MASEGSVLVLDANGKPAVRKQAPVTEAFVICEQGVPTAVCLDEQHVHVVLADPEHGRLRVHRVPIK